MQVTRANTTFQIVNNSVDSNFWQINNWEAENYDRILHPDVLAQCHTFIDVGAWIGPFTLVAAQHYKKVIAFEPDPIAYWELSESTMMNNYPNVEIHEAAVFHYDGELTIGARPQTLGLSTTSFLWKNGTFTVPCFTLQTIYKEKQLTTGTFLKIDIEGAEYNLFQNLDFFKEYKPTILLECHSPYMSKEQYQIFVNGIESLLPIYPDVITPSRYKLTHQFLVPKS
jgi:FkbM family methyltransferase